MKSPVILRIYKNRALIDVKQFQEDQILIGREAEAQLVLDDASVSPVHCLIEKRESGYYICDLGSQSGTFKKNSQILDEPLSSGDEISIGTYSIQFFIGVPKAAAASESHPVKLPPQGNVPPSLGEAVPIKQTIHKASKVVSIKSDKTFAPPSEVKDLREYLKPKKGPLIEVIIAWKERVLQVHHFSQNKKNIVIGRDLLLPSSFVPSSFVFINCNSGVRVNLTASMVAEIILPDRRLDQDHLLQKGKLVTSGSQRMLKLDQGEVLSLSLGYLNIFVRFVPSSQRPTLGAPLDMSAGELTSLIVAAMVVSLLALYFTIYSPSNEDLDRKAEEMRVAQFIYTPRNEVLPPTPQEVPPPKEVTKIRVAEEKRTPSPGSGDSQKPGMAKEIMPKPGSQNKLKKFTSTKQGGAVKIGAKEGANAQSKDVTKTGILGAFGTGGIREKLDSAYSGSGELLGMAEKATGTTGQAEDRLGSDIGSKFKDTGAGGKGIATQGISGIGTKGKGSGQNVYGSGTGLGGKGKVNIEAGGLGEGFVGSIDREAVRRAIMEILNQIKSCYERQLRLQADLSGRVVIKFEIADKGIVTSAVTQATTLNNKEVESCVAARIRAQKFPEPPAGTIAVVDYPFVFSAAK